MLIRAEAVIVSTDCEWRHSLAHTLDSYGIDCVHAGNLRECLEIVAREAVGLIFWDSHLVDASYQELAESMVAIDPHVRIVVVSHMDDRDWRLGGARKTAFAVIPFPCQPTDIEWALSRAVRAELLEDRSVPARELLPHV